MIVPALETVLPVVKKLPECADWSKTVSPFIPQLYALPYQLVEKYNDIDALKHLYLSTNPLISAFFFAAGIVAPIVFIVAEINQNFSQIDRLWSILPPLYTCHYALWAHLSGLPAQRLDHIMAISVLWGIRLTFNYWRKGGYKIGEEDYRWVVVRKYAQTRGWMLLFNLTFISFAQSVSICAFFHLSWR
jgi:steroid 5-alpha reductase family enzyme